jgi:histidyl-tRNA synthetase
MCTLWHLAGILSALSCRCLDQLGELLGEAGADALADLRQLWALAEGYGFKEWLVFDASVVRGLAYYTGALDELGSCVLEKSLLCAGVVVFQWLSAVLVVGGMRQGTGGVAAGRQ